MFTSLPASLYVQQFTQYYLIHDKKLTSSLVKFLSTQHYPCIL